MLEIIKNITSVESPGIVMHGVNCQRVMKSGIAKSLFDKWPNVYKEYMSLSKSEMCLGKTLPVKIKEDLYVMHCWTQERYGYDKKIYADVSAIQSCLSSVIDFAKEKKITNIYSPRIGSGLGGLSWEDDVRPVFEILDRKFPDINITICSLN